MKQQSMRLIIGSRFADSDPAICWAQDELERYLGELPPQTQILSTGDDGVGRWAREVARLRTMTVVEYRLDGHRWRNDIKEATRWTNFLQKSSKEIRGEAWIHLRNEALLQGIRFAQQENWQVEALAIYEPWAFTDTVRLMATGMQALGIPTVEKVAPEIHRPVDVPSGLLVWVDLETGGRRAETNPILEIGAFVTSADGSIPYRSFHRLVQPFPGAVMDAEALSLCGYNKERWDRSAVSLLEAITAFLKWLPEEEFTLAGYNVSFDEGFLNASLQRLGLGKLHRKPTLLDVLRRASEYKQTQGLPNAKLTTIAQSMGFNTAKHRATEDIATTIAVWRRLQGDTAAKPEDTLAFER